MDDYQSIKKKTKEDHSNSVELYKWIFSELKKIEQTFFQLKLVISGFILTVFGFLISSETAFKTGSNVFNISFLVLIIIVVLLISEEVWEVLNKAIENNNKAQTSAILASIRHHSVVKEDNPNYDKFINLGIEAQNKYNSSVQILQYMQEDDTSIDKIIDKSINKISWKFRFILWTSVALVVPALLLFRFLNLI